MKLSTGIVTHLAAMTVGASLVAGIAITSPKTVSENQPKPATLGQSALMKSETSLPKAPCDPTIQAHVYHPDRLKILDPCITVTGMIEKVRSEADGDYHVLLRLDAGQESLLNDKNRTAQNGDLVLEPICAHKVTQADAVSSCQGFVGFFGKPKVGGHVSVTGPWVLDQEHGWQEIHPVDNMVQTH